MAVVIEGRNRYADVNLINTGAERKSYEMGWLFYRMSEETGNYEVANRPTTEFDLTQSLIFSPRRVALGPNETQKIRLALRLKGEPPAPGDYRAHLEMKEVADTKQDDTKDITGTDNDEKKKASVGVGVSVGFSIPIIYRVGDSNATATLGDISTRIEPKTNRLEAVVPVSRSDSPYGLVGHMLVYYTPPGGPEAITPMSFLKSGNGFFPFP
jgi:hypothetical protein